VPREQEAIPTPLEASIDALASAYGLSAADIVDLAIRNLNVVCAYQLGREGASAEQVFRMLLAPALAQRDQVPERVPSVHADEEIVKAASGMVEPFTSRELGASVKRHPGTVGKILAAAGWPHEPNREGYPTRWLPRAIRS